VRRLLAFAILALATSCRSLPFPDVLRRAGADGQFDRGQGRPIVETCRALKPDDIVILATAADLPATARLADPGREGAENAVW